jgi:hypothetical protein
MHYLDNPDVVLRLAAMSNAEVDELPEDCCCEAEQLVAMLAWQHAEAQEREAASTLPV